jgi:hypothetical protein
VSPRLPLPINRAAVWLSFFGAVTLACMAVAARVSAPSVVKGLAVVGFLTAVVWMFLSERYALTLGALVLYLGLADGYLKLSTGSTIATLGRDALLYGICLGALARTLVRRVRVDMAPLTGVVVAYVVLVLVQIFNPSSGGLGRSLGSLRPHIEFVPLFFLAYYAIRTRRQLRAILVVLVVVGAANGVVSYVQFTLTPEQLSRWGPGYANRIEGIGVAARTFADRAGQERVRPFGLAADSGQGGFVGLLALPATIALVSLGRGRWRAVALLLAFAVALAIVTSQGRTVIIGSFVAVTGYLILTIVGRRLVPTLAAVAVIAIVLVGVTSFSSQRAGPGGFRRIDTIAPSRVLQTADAERGSSIAAAPTYATEYPVGAGLGSVGPAATFGRPHAADLNGETQFNFLILELGPAGAAIFLALFAAILGGAFRRLRAVPDPELRALLAALAAPLIGFVPMFFANAITAGSPGAPYFWGVAGVLTYWLRRPPWSEVAGSLHDRSASGES